MKRMTLCIVLTATVGVGCGTRKLDSFPKDSGPIHDSSPPRVDLPADVGPWVPRDGLIPPPDTFLPPAAHGTFGGEWVGYVENFTFASGSDAVRVVAQEDAGGALHGWVSFGQGTPPGLDPDVGFPRDGVINTFIQEGFAFTLSQPVITGQRLVFQLARNEQWSPWCALQKPIEDKQGFFRCLDYGDSGTKGCQVHYPDGWHAVDCTKLALCQNHEACVCDATSCATIPRLDFTFDVTVTTNEMVGSVNFFAGVRNVRLTRKGS